MERIKYVRVDDFAESATDLGRFPFLKRMAFRDEDEIRLILEDYKNENLSAFSLPFDLTIIEEIKLSPWLAQPLVKPFVIIPIGFQNGMARNRGAILPCELRSQLLFEFCFALFQFSMMRGIECIAQD